MKTPFLFFSLLSITVAAQNNFNTQGMNKPYLSGANESWLINLNTAGKIFKSFEWTSSKQKKDKNFVLLDKNGMELERQYVSRWSTGPFKAKRFVHTKTSYTNNLVSKIERLNEQGESKTISLYEYFSPTKFSHTRFVEKNKKDFENFAKYNGDSTIAEFISYKNKGAEKQLVVKYEYDYYADKQHKQTRMFNKKNKLKYTWNYACEAKGELIKEKTSQVCVNKGYDNKGRSVEVTFSTNDKGEKTKNINTYYIFNGNKIFVSYEFFKIKKGKEIKMYESHVADSIEPNYHYISYDKKGRIEFENRIDYGVYNSTKKIAKIRIYNVFTRGKLNCETIEKFDEAGLSMGSESFNKRHKSTGKTVFTYSGDNSYTISHYNHKQRLTEIYTGTIQYY